MDELPGIAFLLKSCPLLETLTVKMGKGVNLNVSKLSLSFLGNFSVSVSIVCYHREMRFYLLYLKNQKRWRKVLTRNNSRPPNLLVADPNLSF